MIGYSAFDGYLKAVKGFVDDAVSMARTYW
jgi:hypothetical protein